MRSDWHDSFLFDNFRFIDSTFLVGQDNNVVNVTFDATHYQFGYLFAKDNESDIVGEIRGLDCSNKDKVMCWSDAKNNEIK